jgi:hypothetical protein
MLLYENKHAKPIFRIAIAGDYLPADRLQPPPDGNWQRPAAAISRHFEDVDLAMVNLECPLDVQSSRPRTKIGLGDNFSTTAAALDFLIPLRAKVVGLANNHVYDFGAGGLQRTKEAILDKGMIPLGSGHSLADPPDIYVALAPVGLRLGFWAAACHLPELATRTVPGVEPATRKRAKSALAALKQQRVHLSVAFLHAGMERTNRPDPRDVRFMDELAAMGFDVVVACHSHRISGFKSLPSANNFPSFCFYGLGSISSGVHYSSLDHEGLLAVIALDEHGRIVQIEARPILLSKEGWGTVPQAREAEMILDRFRQLSSELVDGSYKQHFYRDTGSDLFHRQFRNLRAAFQSGGLAGLMRIIARIRMRHLNRALHKALDF